MRISSPTKTLAGNEASLTVTVSSGSFEREFFYSVPAEFADWFAVDRCDGFLTGLILQAMQRKEDIEVDGPLSSKLFHSLQNFFVPLVAAAFPDLSPIRIVPSSLTNVRLSGVGVSTGFSGGIDSFAAVVRHFVEESSPDHRITHFLFHNAGSHGHGDPDDSRRVFWKRYRGVQPYAREVGVPVVPVDSNVAEIFPIDFVRMHSVINSSFPLVLQNQFQRFYYASAYTYSDCGVGRTDDFARFDPLVLHLLSTESLDCVSTGCEMSRVEKTELITRYEPSRRYLNVCVDPEFEGLNCSICFKCRRTLLTLELLGVSDKYEQVFDLEKFRKIRRKYILETFRYERASFEAEIAELIRNRSRGPLGAAFRIRKLVDRLVWR